MENNKIVIIIAVLILLAGGVIVINLNTPTEGKSSKEEPKPTESRVSEPTNKTDAEVILEGAVLAKNTYDELREKKLKQDSIKRANRKSHWVYQIGLATTNSSDLLKSYNQLKNITNIKVFKSSRKTYFLYKDDGYSKQQVDDSLNNLQSTLAEFNLKAEPLDLITLCTLKDEIVKGKDIKIRKEDVVLLCNTCD